MLFRLHSLSMHGLALAVLAFAFGCSSNSGAGDKNGLGLGAKGGSSSTTSDTGGNGSGNATAANGGSSATNGSGASDGTGATGGTGIVIAVNGGTTGTSNGGATDDAGESTIGAAGADCVPTGPEVCDGIDNDCNGIIDDVDVGHDGVCDCLNIATIGHIGPWSNGGDVFTTWLNARSPLGAMALEDQVITPDLIAPYEIIVSLHVGTASVENDGVTPPAIAPAHHVFSSDEIDAFSSWVKKGGGVMSTIGYTYDEADEVVNVNSLLAPLGMAYSSTKLDLDGNITTWIEHPVTDGISTIKIDNGVEPDGPMGTTLATDSAGRVALQVGQYGDGRMIVWGDEWITYDSEWANVTGEQVELFWLNMLKWLSPPKKCQVPIPPGIVR